MSSASHKNLIAQFFEAISTRSSQNLNSSVFALIDIDPKAMTSEIYINKSIKVDEAKLAQIRHNAPNVWQECKNSGFKTTCEVFSEISDNENPCKYFLETFDCNVLIRLPFELEEIGGGGMLMWAWKEKPEGFGDIYIEKAKLIAEQIKLSLRLGLKEQKGRELDARLAALLELSTAVYSSLNYTEVLEKAINLSMKIIGADGGSILILDKKENVLKPLITIDKHHEKEISQVVLKPGEGLSGRVVKTGMGIISNHSESDPRTFQIPGTPDEPESIISAPLTWSGEVIGVITLRASGYKAFLQEDLDILTIFARQTADAIENAKLYESLEKAYKELTSTQEQLVMTEKLRALGEMAGGVAHDFNNVLGTILGRTQLLLRELGDSKWADYLRQIEQVTLAGAKTVQKLQNFTRISSRSQSEHVDLCRVIDDAIETTKPRWKDECQRRGIYIELKQDLQELNPILGNKTELIEAVSNLILNAIDALSNGGTIRISSYEENDQAIIKVEDNGVGMGDATLNRVFYPFFTTKGINNTGMGLAVVYGIVTRHNGEIDVSSKLGEGTICKLIFPIAVQIRPTSKIVTRIVEEIKARILVIDDDDNIRDVMGDMLEFMNHEVQLAASGEEGIEKFKSAEFDIILTDLGMPGISGWDVTRICKSLKPNIPVVMISGWGNQIDESMIKQSGLDGIMSKPFEMTKIKHMIQEVLARRPDASVDTPAGS